MDKWNYGGLGSKIKRQKEEGKEKMAEKYWNITRAKQILY